MHGCLYRFMAVVVSNAFRKSLKRVGSEGVFGDVVNSDLQQSLQSLAICNFEVAATQVTKVSIYLRWIQEGLKGGFLQQRLNPIRGPFLSDSVRILGVCPAVSPTFGLYLRLSACNSDFRA